MSNVYTDTTGEPHIRVVRGRFDEAGLSTADGPILELQMLGRSQRTFVLSYEGSDRVRHWQITAHNDEKALELARLHLLERQANAGR